MNSEIFAPLFSFALVSSITPGPNNIMLMSSGTNFGFKRTIPHMLGVSIGFTIMAILVGLGLTKLFVLYPFIQKTLTFASIAYLIYLSYKIAISAPIDPNASHKGKPFSFMQAVLFQWVNPKAWTMALAAVTLYAPNHSAQGIFKVALIYGAVNFPCVSLWAFLGKQIRRALNGHLKLRCFNFSMAALLVSSLYFLDM